MNTKTKNEKNRKRKNKGKTENDTREEDCLVQTIQRLFTLSLSENGRKSHSNVLCSQSQLTDGQMERKKGKMLNSITNHFVRS